jgi:hypothetical protein
MTQDDVDKASRDNMRPDDVDKTQVDRMQQDLDAVREVLGCELPFNRDDARFCLVLAATAGFWCVWSLCTDPTRWQTIIGVSPTLLVVVVGGFWAWLRKRTWRNSRPLAARAVAMDMRISTIFTLAVIASVVVGVKAGLTHPLFYATIAFWIAVVYLFIGMMGRSRRYLLAVAASMGILSPIIYFQWHRTSLGLASVAAVFMLTFLAIAAIMHVQLRRNRGA